MSVSPHPGHALALVRIVRFAQEHHDTSDIGQPTGHRLDQELPLLCSIFLFESQLIS